MGFTLNNMFRDREASWAGRGKSLLSDSFRTVIPIVNKAGFIVGLEPQRADSCEKRSRAQKY